MKLLNGFANIGIRKKLVLIMIIAGFFFLVAVVGIMTPLFRWNLTQNLEIQQNSLLSSIQREIDNKITTASTQLSSVAKILPLAAMTTPTQAQFFLEDRVGIGAIFDHGLCLWDHQGTLIANTGGKGPRTTEEDQTSVPTFQYSRNSKASTISTPFRSPVAPYHPVVQFNAPILNHVGEQIGTLSGGMRLDGDNLIGSIAKHKIGKTGHLYLYSNDRTILVHPDPSRILKKDVPVGANQLFDKALTGWEGTAFTVNSRGIKSISSFKHLTSVPWVVASNYPVTEAHLPAKRATIALSIIVLLLGILGMTITWFILKSVTNPLAQLTEHIQNVESLESEKRQFRLKKQPYLEIQLLSASFNAMLSELDQQTFQLENEIQIRRRTEKELILMSTQHEQTALLLQNICDNVPDLIWAKDCQHRYIFTNKAINHTLLLAQSADEPIGKTDALFGQRIIDNHPNLKNSYSFSDMCAVSDTTTLSTQKPMRFQEDGYICDELVCLDVYKAPFYDTDGKLIGTVGSARIITREKQLEQETLHLARLYRILSDINQKVVHKPQPLELFQFVCDTLLADDTFSLAWIGVPSSDGGYTPIVAAGITIDELKTIQCSSYPFIDSTKSISNLNSGSYQQKLCQPDQNLFQLQPFDAVGAYPVQPVDCDPILLVLYTNDSDLLTHKDEKRLLSELVKDLVFALDVAEQDRTQALNLQQLELAATVFENNTEGIIVTDADEKIISVNRAFCEITGYTAECVIGKTPRLLKSNRHDRIFYQTMWHSLTRTNRWQGEVFNRRQDGQIYPSRLSISAVLDSNKVVTHYIAVFSDISQIKESERQVDYLEYHDPLTDLPNRRLFCNHLTSAVERARRSNNKLMLLSLDLDHFKDINDSFGHLIGDALLRRIAKRLQNRFRCSDMVARLGGDEFIILLEDLEHRDQVPLVAQEVLDIIQQPLTLDTGIELQMNTSIGITLFPDHGDNATDLLKKVDAALYQAKRRGRAQFAYYNEEMTAKALERLQLSSHLRHALDNQEFEVYYQPQVELKSGKIIGAEALLRWNNPELGAIPPARFIPLAEELGCIAPIGEWVLKQVCTQGKSWLDAGQPPISLAVNLSPLQFYHADIVKTVQTILTETGFPAKWLELEVTESALMHKEQETIELLHQLHDLDIRLALDDFGTGYSSLSYLKYFPIDQLKIDKSFVDDLPHGINDCKMVTAIIQMGRGLGLRILAEGVENEAQLNCLKEMGCEHYQGYHFSRPIPATDFFALRVKHS